MSHLNITTTATLYLEEEGYRVEVETSRDGFAAVSIYQTDARTGHSALKTSFHMDAAELDLLSVMCERMADDLRAQTKVGAA